MRSTLKRKNLLLIEKGGKNGNGRVLPRGQPRNSQTEVL